MAIGGDDAGPAAQGTQQFGGARLCAGLVQGLALYLLYSAADAHVWPATNGQVFAPLLFVVLGAPLIFILGFGNLRPRTWLSWLAGGVALLAFLGWYDIWHGWPVTAGAQGPRAAADGIIPAPELFVATCAMLFIAQALIAAGDCERRFRASYATLFDVSWKLGIQLALTVVFVGVFWLLLWLGAGLFELVKLDFFPRLIGHRWFAIPVTALAVAAALHLSDVRPALVRGTRTLVLVLLSWLLPVMTAIIAAFLVALLFTGLAPLWQTRSAAFLLLAAVVALVGLINATYRDGSENDTIPGTFRYAGWTAALALMPLSLLAAYATVLRVSQYGWTVERIWLAAVVVVALAYAGGYAIATLRKGPWLKRLEICNFAVALLVLALLFAFFSPIADPQRIAVASQVARLENGKIGPRSFDFPYLRWDGGRFGKAALTRLTAWTGADASYVRRQAEAAMNAKTRYGAPDAAAIAANIAVYPAGQALPESFTRQIADKGALRNGTPFLSCLVNATASCDGFVLDADGDGKRDILIVPKNSRDAVLFSQGADGRWMRAGRIETGLACGGTRDALKEGRFHLVPPAPKRIQDIAVGGQRLVITPIAATPACPKT
jgi:hypothetical protein